MKIKEDVDFRSSQYLEYLNTHIRNVNRAYSEMLEPYLKDSKLKSEVEAALVNHDASKFEPSEWYPYLDYFYGSDKPKDEVDRAFNYAWLHHIHANPHHWQHWILITDEEGVITLDMPESEVIHMLCDWASFRYTDTSYHSTREWYENNNHNMTLSENTKLLIEKYIDYFEAI